MAGDEAALFRVHHSAIHQIARRDYTPEQLDAWAPDNLDPELWARHMQSIQPFVAEEHAEAVGYADVQSSGYIDHFFVSGFRPRQGIGARLMERIHAEAAALGLTELTADVSRTAQPFFERHGFHVVEQRVPVVRGVVVPNAFMRKVLSADRGVIERTASRSEVLAAIPAFRQASPDIATSGQPREEHFRDIAAAGYTTVVNLGLHDDRRYALPDEAGTVAGLGMHYVHIPVRFDNPTELDLVAFMDAMQNRAGEKMWVHCAANMRVTAFLGLYRVLRQGWAPEQAFELMRSVWTPGPVWEAFIGSRLEGRQ